MCKPDIADISTYATAIEIAWPYESQSGMPPSEANAAQLEFERSIDELTGGNGLAELVQVSTGHCVKEWLFYATSRDQFMREFNRLLAGGARYPLEIKFYDDPTWQSGRRS